LINFQGDTELEIIITDSAKKRWEIPKNEPFLNPDRKKLEIKDLKYDVKIGSSPFFLKVSRKSSKKAIFSTENLQFLFTDRYLEISTHLQTKHIFGIGESNKFFVLENGTYTIWTRDFPFKMGWGRPGFNTYGHHPVFLGKEEDKNGFYLVYFRNSNAMDMIFSDEEKLNKWTITYKTIGGILNFKIFLC